MKSIFLTGATLFAATSAMAGDFVEPVRDGGSGEGAIILLALLGVVIASSAIGSMATRNNSTMEIAPTDIDENAGH
ncbi:hypothetical protein SAMN04488005_1183 [Yoonia tamlensis]|uniref:Secreted protein n=1 Tax=Yoonia tamlensis TaxID=390270 RepID=A0A1I6G764_9RHOB|nr:hypothetical protein [Yoonia tamlensis]SFR38043.1 hypothetical protein SAMN04488005_1183 [Yoonia tamlensis]